MKPKIAVIGLKGLPAFGGAATVGENIISHLKEKYDFVVYSVSSHTDLETGIYNGFYQIVFKKIRYKKLNILLYYIRSAWHAFFSNYDLIHLHHRDGAFIIPILKIRYKVFLTTHSLGAVFDKWKKYQFYFTLQEKYFIRLADTISCVSMNEERYLMNKYSINSIYIPNGINCMENLEKEVQVNREEPYLFFGAGRIIRDKGLHLILQSMKLLKTRIKLIVAGDINQTNDYKNEVYTLAKDLNVEFVGLIKDKEVLFNYILGSEIFVYPSSKEAMSMMLLEGASLLKPIICSDIIENRDIFDEDEVLFFKSNDYIDLASKLKWALENTEAMNDKSRLAYKKLINSYLWSNICLKYDEVYLDLIKKGKVKQ